MRASDQPSRALADLPGYPARLVAASRAAAIGCRSSRRATSSIEFVLREPDYRRRMMAEIDPDYLGGADAARRRALPRTAAGRRLKQLGILKPWAPTRSYGLVVRLDARFSARRRAATAAPTAHAMASPSRVEARRPVYRGGQRRRVVVRSPRAATGGRAAMTRRSRNAQCDQGISRRRRRSRTSISRSARAKFTRSSARTAPANRR